MNPTVSNRTPQHFRYNDPTHWTEASIQAYIDAQVVSKVFSKIYFNWSQDAYELAIDTTIAELESHELPLPRHFKTVTGRGVSRKLYDIQRKLTIRHDYLFLKGWEPWPAWFTEGLTTGRPGNLSPGCVMQRFIAYVVRIMRQRERESLKVDATGRTSIASTDLETRAARVEPGKRKPVRIIGSGSLRRVASSDSSASESESESESDSDTDRARETKRQRVDAMAASSARGIEESDLRRDSCASPTILCGNGSLGAVQDDRRPGHSHSNAICTTTADVAALQTASNKAQQYRRENPHLHDNAALQSPNEPGPNSNTHPRSAALPRTLIEPMTPSTICLAALQSQCASMAAEITAMKLEHARDRESLTKRVTELEAHNERRRQQYA